MKAKPRYDALDNFLVRRQPYVEVQEANDASGLGHLDVCLKRLGGRSVDAR
jgi:hypothetical protein